MKKKAKKRITSTKAKSKVLGKAPALDHGGEYLRRVRRICVALPGTSEKLSHGEPTFFAAKKVYCMFANNHHNDGHVAVWIPAEPGAQEALIRSDIRKYFRPPYVGVKGWVGVELSQVSDDELGMHLSQAYRLIAPKKSASADKNVTTRSNRVYDHEKSKIDEALNHAQIKRVKNNHW